MTNAGTAPALLTDSNRVESANNAPLATARRTPYTWPEATEPTDEQVAAWLKVCTPEERLERVQWWREQARIAQECWRLNHKARLDDCQKYRRLGQVVPGV